MTMATAVRTGRHAGGRWSFSVDDYLWLHESGRIPDDVRTELIDGEIRVMSPTGPPHGSSTMVLHQRLVQAIGERAHVWCQTDVQLGLHTMVVPDLTVLRSEPSGYATRLPNASDALLIIEVAQSSLRYDRGRKLRLYARAGVPEVWIAALSEQVLDVYRSPDGARYAETEVLQPGDVVAPLALPDVVLDVGEVLRSRFIGAGNEGQSGGG